MYSVRNIDGVDVHIEGAGSETIVMVHGWPDTYRLWDDQVAFLKAQFRCLRFTLPGFDLAKPRRAHSLDQLVTSLQHIVEASCPGEKVTLLLHDWGCIFGYQFAMRHPELVKRIVGVDVGDAGSRAHLGAMPFKAKAMVLGYQGWLAIAWKLGGRWGDAMTRKMARWLRCPADPGLISSAMNYPYYIAWTGAHGGYRRALPLALNCPMLYVYGRKKPFQFHSPAWAAALRERPGSQVLEFGTGHWVMKNKPAEFNQALATWLLLPA